MTHKENGRERKKKYESSKLKRKDREKMEKPDCSKGKDKRLKIRKEGREMDQEVQGRK